jgi:post-segregation antitoxin (ccd killing protein)
MNKRAVRKNVSLPAWLSEEADRENINVSRVLQEALLEKLHL